MNINLIKYWNKKSYWTVFAINILIIAIFLILSILLIKNNNNKIINIIAILVTNAIFMAIIFAFSISETNFETVYQIQLDNQGYNIKKRKYFIILFAFAWLTFFIINALYMLLFYTIKKDSLNYFVTLSKVWWILLIIVFYHVLLIASHRQLLKYVLYNQKMPWEKNKTSN